ncbi:MAG: hypothetical protein D6729_04925 [Deltaproteobacteria bacterium]|nr:MAG: hypothetical protein D6729_04925 [Deltaproteobacteria bacterium]
MAEAPRTMLATEGLRIGGLLMAKLASVRLGTQPVRVVRVTDPEVSTEGGKRARQNISLHPEGGEAATLVVGWMDASTRVAELRTFEVVQAHFQARFGMPSDIDPEAYDRFIEAARVLLEGEGFTVKRVRAAPKATTARKEGEDRPGGWRRWALVYGLIALLAAGAGIAAYLSFR